MEFNITPFFLKNHPRQLFVINYSPVDHPPAASIIFLPPFAEEMHKSRHLVSQQARQFAEKGYQVVVFDLTGCGDSPGSFEDATWEIWTEDAYACCDWLTSTSSAPLFLWGLRTGGLLATALSTQYHNATKLLLWQPVIDGEHFVKQFIRQKLATHNLLSGSSEKLDSKNLLNNLNNQGYIEIGGYNTAETLLTAISRLKITDNTPQCPVYWLELGLENSETLCPASHQAAAAWRESDVKLITKTIKGQPFWSTQELLDSPELIKTTSDVLLS